MNKEDNAYFTLAQQFKELKSPPMQIYIGNVTSIDPLLINCAGIQLDRKDLLINKEMLKGIQSNVSILADNVVGDVKPTGILDSLNMTSGIIENIGDKFRVGSKVVLLTEDNQKFVLLCEVM